MAVTYGFYDSLNHDRLYNAQQMSAIFDGIINDGVFMSVGNQFHTVAGTGMQVIVKSGRAWFDSTWTLNDAEYPLSIDAADVLLTRIDAVVLEVNSEVATRANTIKVVKGTPASTPAKPTLTNTATIHQHALAYVTVAKNTTAITNSMIEIVVGKTETPYVTAILQTTDITDLFNKWENDFQVWFETVRSTLDGDVALNLQNQITTLERSILKADTKTAMGLPSDAVGDDAFKYMLNRLSKYKLEIGNPEQTFYTYDSEIYETPKTFVLLKKNKRGDGDNTTLYSYDMVIYPKDGSSIKTIPLHPRNDTEYWYDEKDAVFLMDTTSYTFVFGINLTNGSYDKMRYIIYLSPNNDGTNYDVYVHNLNNKNCYPAYILSYINGVVTFESYKSDYSEYGFYIPKNDIFISKQTFYNNNRINPSIIPSIDPNYTLIKAQSRTDSSKYYYNILNNASGNITYTNVDATDDSPVISYADTLLYIRNSNTIYVKNITSDTEIFVYNTQNAITIKDIAVTVDQSYLYVLIPPNMTVYKFRYSTNGTKINYEESFSIKANIYKYYRAGLPVYGSQSPSTKLIIYNTEKSDCHIRTNPVFYAELSCFSHWPGSNYQGASAYRVAYFLRDHNVIESTIPFKPMINTESKVFLDKIGNVHNVIKIPYEEV